MSSFWKCLCEQNIICLFDFNACCICLCVVCMCRVALHRLQIKAFCSMQNEPPRMLVAANEFNWEASFGVVVVARFQRKLWQLKKKLSNFISLFQRLERIWNYNDYISKVPFNADFWSQIIGYCYFLVNVIKSFCF